MVGFCIDAFAHTVLPLVLLENTVEMVVRAELVGEVVFRW